VQVAFIHGVRSADDADADAIHHLRVGGNIGIIVGQVQIDLMRSVRSGDLFLWQTRMTLLLKAALLFFGDTSLFIRSSREPNMHYPHLPASIIRSCRWAIRIKAVGENGCRKNACLEIPVLVRLPRAVPESRRFSRSCKVGAGDFPGADGGTKPRPGGNRRQT
jgi:hypothetical protein